METTERYKGYIILAFEREARCWRAKISKAEGTDIIVLLPDIGGPFPTITTSADTITPDAAITLAKKAIDGGGMK